RRARLHDVAFRDGATAHDADEGGTDLRVLDLLLREGEAGPRVGELRLRGLIGEARRLEVALGDRAGLGEAFVPFPIALRTRGGVLRRAQRRPGRKKCVLEGAVVDARE